MRKKLLLSVLILLMALPLLSFKSIKETQRIITPQVALVVSSRQMLANLEMNENQMNKEKETVADNKEETFIKQDDADVYYNLGISHSNAGMYKEAIEAYKQAIKIKPDFAEAHYNLGLAYDELGMFKKAIEAYREAIKIKPDFAKTHHNLGLINTISENKVVTPEENKESKDHDSQIANKQHEKDIQKGLVDKENIYILQIGAFKNIDNANKLIEKLKTDYQYVYIERENNLNKVRISRIKTKEEGNLIIKEINEKLKLKPFLIGPYK